MPELARNDISWEEEMIKQIGIVTDTLEHRRNHQYDKLFKELSEMFYRYFRDLDGEECVILMCVLRANIFPTDPSIYTKMEVLCNEFAMMQVPDRKNLWLVIRGKIQEKYVQVFEEN